MFNPIHFKAVSSSNQHRQTKRGNRHCHGDHGHFFGAKKINKKIFNKHIIPAKLIAPSVGPPPQNKNTAFQGDEILNSKREREREDVSQMAPYVGNPKCTSWSKVVHYKDNRVPFVIPPQSKCWPPSLPVSCTSRLIHHAYSTIVLMGWCNVVQPPC